MYQIVLGSDLVLGRGRPACLRPRHKAMVLRRSQGGASTPMPRTQNHGFASQKGRGKPLHAHDAIVRYGTYKTYITQNHGFASQAGRG